MHGLLRLCQDIFSTFMGWDLLENNFKNVLLTCVSDSCTIITSHLTSPTKCWDMISKVLTVKDIFPYVGAEIVCFASLRICRFESSLWLYQDDTAITAQGWDISFSSYSSYIARLIIAESLNQITKLFWVEPCMLDFFLSSYVTVSLGCC